MRLGIITPYPRSLADCRLQPDDTGVKLHVRPLIKALADRRVSVTVFGPRDADSQGEWYDGSVRVMPTFDKKDPFSLLSLVNRIRRADIDIVHVHHELYAFGGMFSALLLPLVLSIIAMRGIPIITTFHGVLGREDVTPDFVRRNGLRFPSVIVWWVWSGILSRIASVSKMIHVHEPHLRETLIRDYGIVSDRIIVLSLPIGVSSDLTRTEARARLRLRQDSKVVLFFGFINAYKGIEELLGAAELFLAEDQACELIIAGSVPARFASVSSILERLAAAAQHPRIRVTGFVPEEEVESYFRAADLLILPYKESIAASGPLSKALAFETPALMSTPVARSYSEVPISFDVTAESMAKALQVCFSGSNLERLRQYWSTVARGRSCEKIAESFLEVYRRYVSE